MDSGFEGDGVVAHSTPVPRTTPNPLSDGRITRDEVTIRGITADSRVNVNCGELRISRCGIGGKVEVRIRRGWYER